MKLGKFEFALLPGVRFMDDQEKIKIEKGIAEVNGTQLYYEIAGSGDPIVLIHGGGGDCRHWDDQFETFTQNHKVIRYDRRGFGKSAMPVQEEIYSHYDDLKALLEHFSILKAHICGQSMGCGIAVDFVFTYPEMSSSLIAVAPWVSGYDSPAVGEMGKIFEKITSIVKEKGTRAAMDYNIDEGYKNVIINPRILERIREIGYDYSFWHYTNRDGVYDVDPPVAQQIDKIGLPTLIITAEYDLKACREVADLLEQNIANAKKVVIAKACHNMNMEKPAEFNKLVLDFIRKLE